MVRSTAARPPTVEPATNASTAAIVIDFIVISSLDV
jgi:hypothetical protein